MIELGTYKSKTTGNTVTVKERRDAKSRAFYDRRDVMVDHDGVLVLWDEDEFEKYFERVEEE